MCDEWMPVIRLKMSIDEFHRLPRNAAYKYEYWDGESHLSPRPKTLHAALDVATFRANEDDLSPESEYVVEPATVEDHDDFARLFSAAFSQTQPFASVADDERRVAARECLRRTFEGEDGPWVREASFVARQREDRKSVAVLLITLLPDGDPSDWRSYTWDETPPENLWQSGGGRPHLTWIFTNPWLKGEGLGTRLLASAVEPLRRRGDKLLYSTFIAGNDSSMLWHWRNGFTLLPSLLSKRGMRNGKKSEGATTRSRPQAEEPECGRP